MKLLASGVRALFLGAGKGTRLLPHTANCAKWELNVGGLTILERLIACAHECGIADVVVVRGKAGGIVHCPSVVYVEDDAGHNMVHSLFKARDHIVGDIVISYADILYEPEVLERLLACDATISVVVDLDWATYFETRADEACNIAESLLLDGSRITSIGQPLKSGEMPSGQYIGLIKASPAGALILQKVYDDLLQKYGGKCWRNALNFENAYMTDLLQELIDRNVEVRAVPIRGGWVEFDTPRDYEQVLDWIVSGRIQKYLRLDTLPRKAGVLSAGGVVVRHRGPICEALLVGDGSPRGWRLPKGMQEPGEQITATALREVKEESGIDAEILEYVGRAQWSYTYEAQVWDERVHFFLMRAVGGSVEKHDPEFSEVTWMAIETVQPCLMFESEARIVADARQLLKARGFE